MTFYHHVENMHKVSHRHIVQFNVNYVNENNIKIKKQYGYYARKRDEGVVTDLEPMSKVLWQKKLYSGSHYNSGNGLRTIMAKDLYKEISQIYVRFRSKR